MRRLIAIALVLIAGCGNREPKYLKEYEALAAKQPALLAEAKKLGIPVEVEDLKGKPVVPKEQNAAYDYLSIDGAYLLGFNGSPLDKLVKTQAAKQDIKGAEWQLYTLTPMFKIADKAARKPYCQFEHDWTLGCAVLLPELGTLKTVARIYCAKAVLCAIKGDVSGFQSSIAKSFAVAGCFDGSPGTLPMLVQIAIRAITFSAIRTAISEGKNPLELTRGLKEIVAKHMNPIDYRWQLLTEGTIGRMSILRFIKPMKDEKELVQTISELSKINLTPASAEGLKKSVGIPLATAQKANDARFLQFIIMAKKALDSDPPVEAAKFLEEAFDAMLIQNEVCTYALETVFTGSWAQPAYSTVKSRSTEAVTLGLLEAFDYRREHGAFPAKITQIDPFDGKPLDYQKTADGFNIASRFGPIKTKFGLFPKEPETETQKRLLHFEYKNKP